MDGMDSAFWEGTMTIREDFDDIKPPVMST